MLIDEELFSVMEKVTGGFRFKLFLSMAYGLLLLKKKFMAGSCSLMRKMSQT